MRLSSVDELRLILDEAKRIIVSTASWEIKYDLIFSEAISKRVSQLIRLEYYDPDTSYEEDVRAYVDALENKVAELGTL